MASPHNYSSTRSAARFRPLNLDAALTVQATYMLARLVITEGGR